MMAVAGHGRERPPCSGIGVEDLGRVCRRDAPAQSQELGRSGVQERPSAPQAALAHPARLCEGAAGPVEVGRCDLRSVKDELAVGKGGGPGIQRLPPPGHDLPLLADRIEQLDRFVERSSVCPRGDEDSSIGQGYRRRIPPLAPGHIREPRPALLPGVKDLCAPETQRLLLVVPPLSAPNGQEPPVGQEGESRAEDVRIGTELRSELKRFGVPDVHLRRLPSDPLLALVEEQHFARGEEGRGHRRDRNGHDDLPPTG